ncbi:MAG: CHAT domain-containing protein, partial [Verrucomicrobiales bacterium]|nr:CHAT domain-containing protein [Verrucomicrobiales bacterium]
MSPIHASIRLGKDGWLDFRRKPEEAKVSRRLVGTDFARFRDWNRRYRQALGRSGERPTMLALGREIHGWLDGGESILETLLERTDGTAMVVEFSIGRDSGEDARAFLDAPWELVADEQGHWAVRDTVLWCPVRRVGTAQEPAPPSDFRLTAVFMAAAPQDLAAHQELDFEGEEAAVLRATEKSPVDLIVEESGMLDSLGACMAREKPDLVHISCHGEANPEPGLLLENELGRGEYATLDKIQKLTSASPRLLFLSACKTAEADGLVDSLAGGLVVRGVPAVVGWRGSVKDREATLFAASLYRCLADELDVARAVAQARFEMAGHEELGPAGARD